MDLDTRIFYYINDFARDNPWMHPVVVGYANDGVVLFAIFLLAGWWIARRTNNLSAMTVERCRLPPRPTGAEPAGGPHRQDPAAHAHHGRRTRCRSLT